LQRQNFAAHAASTAHLPPRAGDSRAVLGRGGGAVTLTSDHKASRPDEVARVQVRTRPGRARFGAARALR
jgi:serine/threonine protein phosphatase PrpC